MKKVVNFHLQGEMVTSEIYSSKENFKCPKFLLAFYLWKAKHFLKVTENNPS